MITINMREEFVRVVEGSILVAPVNNGSLLPGKHIIEYKNMLQNAAYFEATHLFLSHKTREFASAGRENRTPII